MADLVPKPCASCKAPIVWATTVKGKKIPLDAKPSKRVVLMQVTDGTEARIVDTYMPHHATCPDADNWRKR